MNIDMNLQVELLIKVLETYKEKWGKDNIYNVPEISALVSECDDYILELKSCPTADTVNRITESINKYGDIIAEKNTEILNSLGNDLMKM